MKPWADDEVQHGTYAGAQWHNRNKVPKCEPCRRAFAEYTKARRKSDPEVIRRHEAMRTAERRAKSRLIREYAKKYRAYYEQELTAIYAEWQTPTEGSSMSPQRIQLSRRKGWRKPEGSVVVSRPSAWGNPFYLRGTQVLLRGVSEELFWADRPTVEFAREEAVISFRKWLNGKYPGAVILRDRRTAILETLSDLRGKDLACWCPLDQPCHADVLLELANLTPTQGAA